MFRTRASQTCFRAFSGSSAPAHRASMQLTRSQSRLTPANSKTRAISAYQPRLSIIRHASSAAYPGTYYDAAKEEEYGKKILKAEPKAISASSTMTEVVGGGEREDDTDMMAGIKHDMAVIKDTFDLKAVPREAYRIGLAGVLPYLATSAATVLCAVEINDAAHHGGSGYIMSGQTAEALLHVLEPIQVGYGAVILSFLGAIHWGLEWANFGGKAGYNRYAIGVIAPAVAWPTILLPVEYALITQFLAFNLLYAVDSAATVRGWVPSWYSSYRFILTFIVGTSIVISLIGRGQIADRIGALPTAAERIRELQAQTMSYQEKSNKEEEEE